MPRHRDSDRRRQRDQHNRLEGSSSGEGSGEERIMLREEMARMARMEQMRALQQEMARIDQANSDLNRQKGYIERRRDNEIQEENSSRDRKIIRVGQHYNPSIREMENAITQAIRDNPFEVQAAMNLLEITIQERNDKIENIRIKSAEKVNDILQRHQSAIDDINARLERIERDRQRVFRRIEAVEEAERNAVQAAAAREAAREAALAERTPSPSQEDMLRWHHWSS
jgi:hypothetical protein